VILTIRIRYMELSTHMINKKHYPQKNDSCTFFVHLFFKLIIESIRPTRIKMWIIDLEKEIYIYIHISHPHMQLVVLRLHSCDYYQDPHNRNSNKA